MSWLAAVLAVLVVGNAALWLLLTSFAWRTKRRLRLLTELEAPDLDPWPLVSVIIPACNEVDSLRAAMRSRLQTDYPNIEFVLVDDRSSDGTSELVDKLASEDSRIRALHIHELPEGWLGKVHALHQGAGVARGDWLLFSDADVHVAPGSLRKAVAWCEHEGFDHLAGMPEFLPTGFVLDTVISVFVRLVAVAGRIWAVEDPRSKASAGSGAFNLERRSTFERSEGFAWLKLEVADDAALGELMKRSGARCTMVNGRGALQLTFYTSVMDMARKAEKNGYAVLGHYSLSRVVLGSLALLSLDLVPLLGFIPVGLPWLPWVATGALALGVGTSALANLGTGRPLLPALFPALGAILFAWMMLRSGWIGWRRGGISWRGTFYPTSVLKQGQRLKLI